MKSFTYQDNVFTFEGCVSMQYEKEWVAPWRISFEQFDFFHSSLTNDIANACSGVRLCLRTDSVNLRLKLAEVSKEMVLDLYVNQKLHEKKVIDESVTQIFFSPLSQGMKDICIYLDQSAPFKLCKLEIDNDASISKVITKQKRWVHYGSSISHSWSSGSPSEIWTVQAARKMDLHLTNLGFDGNCMIDPMVAMMIRDLSVDYITLKMGVNCYKGQLTERTFGPNVIGFIQIIREKHPLIPLAIISPIFCLAREDVKGPGGLNLQDMRLILLNIVESCKRYGDNNIYYIDGLSVLGTGDSQYLYDGLHPDTKGQSVMAENFVANVFSKIME